ncbi:DUF4123 domain-containing protein [Oceanicola sp. 502str15]|uniref:DUF4123 domain-containing protein n=1 Tax=Oceanicola sp. 502str15 TaxID=2696061 RepID=UPI0020953F7E|nr:DUF4123 domain-containing protein [Oceanicola sp. 502str15]MCO6382859.1 DUF4123 domain-containing protein [Oceanicola sp. 502str15]
MRRIPLGDSPREALDALLFGAVEPRTGARTLMQGPAKKSKPGTFILIEAAKRPDFGVVLEGIDCPSLCLYQGQSADDFARHAPYIAEVEPGSRAADWLIEESWGKGWGVWLRTTRSMTQLRAHFRKFTQLYNPDEDRWYVFRFYAPETLRRVVPVLPPSEFSAFTQDIGAVIAANGDGSAAIVI